MESRCLIVESNTPLAKKMQQYFFDNAGIASDVAVTLKDAHEFLSRSSSDHVMYNSIIIDANTPFRDEIEISSSLELINKNHSLFHTKHQKSVDFIEHVNTSHNVENLIVTIGYLDRNLIDEFISHGADCCIRKGTGFFDRLLKAIHSEQYVSIDTADPYEKKCILNISLMNNEKASVELLAWLIPFDEGPPSTTDHLFFESELNEVFCKIPSSYFDEYLSSKWHEQLKSVGDLLWLTLKRSTQISDAYNLAKRHYDDRNIVINIRGEVDTIDKPFEICLQKEGGDEYLLSKHPINRQISRSIRYNPVNLSEIKHKNSLNALVVSVHTFGKINIDEENLEFLPDPKDPSEMDEEARLVRQILNEDNKQRFFVNRENTRRITKDYLEQVFQRKWDLFHYIGHGVHCKSDSDKSCIIVWKDNNSDDLIPIYVHELKKMMQDAKVKFAYFSCCESVDRTPPKNAGYFGGLMHGIVNSEVPTILGFRWPLIDDYGTYFAELFYRKWLQSESIIKAAYQARRDSKIKYLHEHYSWATSVLIHQRCYTRPDQIIDLY